jgi:two-component system, NtrC family, sensor histidine kinase HydH
MMKINSVTDIFKNKSVKPLYSGLLFLIIAVIIIVSGIVEYQQSKFELNDLMRNQAHSILNTIIISSQNTLASEEQLEEALKERLLNNASYIKILFEQKKISDAFLQDFAVNQNLFRINIFSKSGYRLFCSVNSKGEGRNRIAKHPMIDLAPVFSGEKDTIIIGMKEDRIGSGTRYVVVLAAKDRSAIVVNVEAEQLAQMKKMRNLDFLIRQILAPGEIVYYALQDTNGLVASSPNVKSLDQINQSEFLQNALDAKKFFTRTYKFNSSDVFEAVKQFDYKGNNIGILRLGLSLDYLNQLNKRTFNRILINSIILLITGIIFILIIMLRQNYKILKKQYQAVETFSGDVIRTVSDAVIVYDNKNGVKVFNKAAEKLFGLKDEVVIGMNILSILDQKNCSIIFESKSFLGNLECKIDNRIRNLLVSRNEFYDESGDVNNVLVIRDLTELKGLESQLQRKERLTAMGALASGVAHEIRNPLNSIGTIAQQLNKDFESLENKDEYHKLTKIIYSEVKRINETVTNFLRFAKPDPILPHKFRLSELFNEIINQYTAKLSMENISLSLSVDYDTEVVWDKNQIRQVVVNLLENAKDAIVKDGKIKISISKLNDIERDIEIRISDNGKGIPEEIRNKIFNLYYTTKPSGTGIGLSIVQKIIDEHNGVIFVESAGVGTTFILQLPEKII